MNRKMVFRMIGQIVLLEAGLLLLPAIVSACYGETVGMKSYLFSAGVALVLGSLLILLFRPATKVIFAKEGFVIVALCWLVLSAIGALPFVFSGELPTYADAFFETVSGFTTTGASVITDLTSISHGTLFWRSFTHWIGGMGVLVMIVAILPSAASGRSIHILRAEMPGPVVGKLVPRLRDTAKILYLIYIGMTFVEMILLLFGGMDLFESLVHAFGTAGTGGFGIWADSVGSYSPYLQWVLAIFMLLFGINFNLFYLILTRHLLTALKSRELWVYLGIIVAASALIAGNLYVRMEDIGQFSSVEEVLRASVFQVVSVITTTGYSTVDFNLWPGFSKGILFILFFVGGCAGSTAGGLKVSRGMLLWKSVKRDLQKMIHPRAVSTVKLEGKQVDEATVSATSTYFVLYFLLLTGCFLLIAWEPFDFETNLTAAVTCLNNVGPGLGAVGPCGSFAGYSAFSKIVMSVTMLFGRLEIYPMLFLLTPSTWWGK